MLLTMRGSRCICTCSPPFGQIYLFQSSHFKPLHHPEHLCDDVNKLTRLSDFFTNDVKVQIIANGLNCVAFEPNGHYTSVKVKILATGFYNLVVPWRAMLQSWGWDAQIHMLGSGSGWALQLLQCWLGWCWCSCTPSIYVMRYIWSRRKYMNKWCLKMNKLSNSKVDVFSEFDGF